MSGLACVVALAVGVGPPGDAVPGVAGSYGRPVDVTVLARVDRAELAVRALGFRELRVRHLGTTARLEVPLDEVPDALALRTTIDEQLAAVGYDTVVIDPDGLRSGNLNDALALSEPGGSAAAPT